MKEIVDKVIRSGRLPLKSQGKSMLPILQPGDTLYFKKTTLAKIKINDLVVIKKGGQFICHRVIYKTNKYLITKGDNSPRADGKIYPRQVIGKVIKIKRNGKIFHPENLYLIQSTLYFQEIVKIKEAFEKEGINFVFLKGLPLHLYYEGAHPKRIYADCDVLVDKNDFIAAEKILLKQGYQKAQTSLTKTHQKLKEKEIENAYVKIIGGFSVVFDLHLEVVFMMTQLGRLEALYPQKLIDQLTEEFLKTKKSIKIQNSHFPLLSSNFQIIYLALHLFHHNFRGAFRYKLLDLIIRKMLKKKWEVRGRKLDNEVGSGIENRTSHLNYPTSRFTPITSLILKYKLNNFVYPVFVLLKKYYKTPVPNSFIKAICPLQKKWKLRNGEKDHTSHFNHPASYFTLLTSILKTNIFDDEPRIRAGVNRFKNLFFLSPEPLWKKIFVFTSPQVVFSVFWVLFKRIFKKRSGK